MAQALKVPRPNDADGNRGRLETLPWWRKQGSNPREGLPCSAWEWLPTRLVGPDLRHHPAPGPGPSTGGSPSGARKLKLSSVLDPTLDAEVTPLGQAEVQQLYQDYKTKFGDYPSPEADPSSDQLASLRQVVTAGSAPYADFSLFGPHGLRLLRKQTFTSYTLNVATGEWSKKEQPGPASYHAWVEAWKVLRTALLLLEVADAERLDAYAEHVRSFVTQFGDSAWWLVYRAENRMRCEHMERIRRVLHDRPDYGYTASRPWNAAFAAAVKDGDFWTRELVTPATLWLSQRQPGSGSGEAPARTPTVGTPGQGKVVEARTSRPRRRPGQARRNMRGRTCPRRRGASSLRTAEARPYARATTRASAGARSHKASARTRTRTSATFVWARTRLPIARKPDPQSPLLIWMPPPLRPRPGEGRCRQTRLAQLMGAALQHRSPRGTHWASRRQPTHLRSSWIRPALRRRLAPHLEAKRDPRRPQGHPSRGRGRIPKGTATISRNREQPQLQPRRLRRHGQPTDLEPRPHQGTAGRRQEEEEEGDEPKHANSQPQEPATDTAGGRRTPGLPAPCPRSAGVRDLAGDSFGHL